MKPLLAWIVNRTHRLKRLRGARSAQQRQNRQRKWVDEGFVRTDALPSVPPKRLAHIHACLPLLLLSLSASWVHMWLAPSPSLANQWALSPITLHNDPLFEPTDICGGEEKRELQLQLFCLVLLQGAALIWLCLEKEFDQGRLSRWSGGTYPEEGTPEPGSILNHTELTADSYSGVFAFFNPFRSQRNSTYSLLTFGKSYDWKCVKSLDSNMFLILELNFLFCFVLFCIPHTHKIVQTTLKKSVVWVGCGW